MLENESVIGRRDFMKTIAALSALLGLAPQQLLPATGKKTKLKPFPPQKGTVIYTSNDADPAINTRKLIKRLGGVDHLFGKNDIIILKVNSQWWAQGMTNTDVLYTFIEEILNMPGFKGEVIIADNHQSEYPNDRGWITRDRNGNYNYNELIDAFYSRGFKNISKYHWHPAGPNPRPLQFGGSGNAVVTHPADGDGYVWPKDLYYTCPHGNRCPLAYPVFTSAYSGTTIDLKNGAYRDGDYTGQPVRFINFSAINHHGAYAGVTASIKNYMGVVDMSCGYPGPLPENAYNTHHIGASDTFKILARNKNILRKIPGFYGIYLHPSVFRFHYTGAVLGAFMREIRPADLHIITAIRVGWGGRIEKKKAAQTNMITASTDPVALDYWTAKHVLLDATKKAGAPKKYIQLNDPDDVEGPFRRFLEECRRELGGTTDPGKIEVNKT